MHAALLLHRNLPHQMSVYADEQSVRQAQMFPSALSGHRELQETELGVEVIVDTRG